MSKSKYELKQETLRGLYRKATDAHRRLIQHAAEEDIEWRGEDYRHFLRVVGEVDLSRRMHFADYRFEAVRWLKSLKVGALPYDKGRQQA